MSNTFRRDKYNKIRILAIEEAKFQSCNDDFTEGKNW